MKVYNLVGLHCGNASCGTCPGPPGLDIPELYGRFQIPTCQTFCPANDLNLEMVDHILLFCELYKRFWQEFIWPDLNQNQKKILLSIYLLKYCL